MSQNRRLCIGILDGVIHYCRTQSEQCRGWPDAQRCSGFAEENSTPRGAIPGAASADTGKEFSAPKWHVYPPICEGFPGSSPITVGTSTGESTQLADESFSYRDEARTGKRALGAPSPLRELRIGPRCIHETRGQIQK